MSQPVTLSPKQRQAYLQKHLPYRINMMLAQALMEHRIVTNHPWKAAYQDGLTNPVAFELSAIMGRILLEFLGIKWKQKENVLDHREGPGKDVDVTVLFPSRGYFPLNDPLVTQHTDLLIQLIKVAHKRVAHFTDHILLPYKQEEIPKACLVVYRMLRQHIPEIDPQHIWWHEQVEKRQTP